MKNTVPARNNKCGFNILYNNGEIILIYLTSRASYFLHLARMGFPFVFLVISDLYKCQILKLLVLASSSIFNQRQQVILDSCLNTATIYATVNII